MFFVYRVLANLIFLFSPLIILIRLFKKKNIPKGLKKNFQFILKKGFLEN